ncbi:MAG: hypothetical protein ACXU9O_10650 [Gemmatimonadaceae bacterium]
MTSPPFLDTQGSRFSSIPRWVAQAALFALIVLAFMSVCAGTR